MASLFGGNSTTQNGGSSANNIFGNNANNQQNPGTSLFGSNNNTAADPARRGGITALPSLNTGGNAGTSLFGGNTTATQNQPLGSSLFGGNTNTTTQNQTGSTSLFGGNTAAQNPTQTNTLFGGANTTTQTQPTNQATGTSLFGAPQQPAAPSLFASTQQAPNPTPSLFNTTTSNQPNSLFQPQPQPQSQQVPMPTLLQSGLSTTTPPTLTTLTHQDLARSRLTDLNILALPNDKTVLSQIQTLIRKWDPNSTDTLLQTWLYNAVNAVYAPFYHRNVAAGEGEEGWEAALAAKPASIKPSDDGGIGSAGEISFIPVLVRGFHALGQRIEYQARTVHEMRLRLHEMNSSLDAVLSQHSQALTVRLENAKRRHVVLAQRVLRLAVKAQMGRWKYYPLDASEEALRKVVGQLEKGVFDEKVRGREEEVWGRLVVLRERGRWLEEEGKRVAGVVGETAGGGEGGGVSEEVLRMTRKVLRDYAAQLALLERELGEVSAEFVEWLGGR